MRSDENTIDSSADAGHDYADLISATPPDVLWATLFGFPPSDPMFFRDLDGGDSARAVAALLATAGVDGFPIIGQSGERCWHLPARLTGPELESASRVLTRALDLASADETSARHLDDDGRSAFDVPAPVHTVKVADPALGTCLRTLLELPDWWEAPKVSLVLANRPADTHWRIGVSGMDMDLLSWRAAKAVEETLETPSLGYLALLDTPSGRGFRAALGPAPYGYVRRIELARADPFFERSAASWLAAVARESFMTLGAQAPFPPDGSTWQWAGTKRGGLSAACLRLSGGHLGSLAEKIVISGPFEPSGSPVSISFLRVRHGGNPDPLLAFMSAAMAGESL